MNTEALKQGLKLLYRKRELAGARQAMEARVDFNNEIIGYNKAMEAMLGFELASRIAHESWVEFDKEF